MLRSTESHWKFFLKMGVVAPLRSFLLSFSKSPANTRGWGDRILLINLEGMGDLVMLTSVLKHYQKDFPRSKIYILIKSGTGTEKILEEHFVDTVLSVNYRRFAIDPIYGWKFVNSLRKIGFRKVVNHDFSAAEIAGKIIATSVGAEEVVGYEGQAIEFEKPFDFQQAKNLMIVRRKIFPKYTKLIPTTPSRPLAEGYLPHEIEYYKLVYEAVAGKKNRDYSTTLFFKGSSGPEFLSKFGLLRNRYIVFNANSSARSKCWPYERFCEVAKYFHNAGFRVVLIGSRRERVFTDAFQKMCPVKTLNCAGGTNFEELLSLVTNCFMVFTNDTSTVHLAVALKKPSLCVVGGGQFGVAVDYGYEDINKWVYQRTPCSFDNWRCSRGLIDRPAPCVDAVSADDVVRALNPLVSYLEKGGDYPKKNFVFRFPEASGLQHIAPRKKLKIVYAGIQADNYNPKRKPSFEYSNFYEMLKNMPGVEVVEYPYDTILEVGKEKFNRDLLQLIKVEKPDLFFAFMFSDELNHETLDEIKKITKSVAWFADDHWRLHNYSRFSAPHFTLAVTTWSLAPLIYTSYGVENIVRSQWACNTKLWRSAGGARTVDVSFVGQKTGARVAAVEALRKAGVKVLTRGWGWPEGRALQEDMVKIFSSSKISLNLNNSPKLFSPASLGRLLLKRSRDKLIPDFHLLSNFKSWFGMSVPQIKARPFELAGCGSFTISGPADDTDKYYEEGREMVFYESTDDLIKKIKYYLKHDKEREEIAKAGYERTIRDHTYEKRFEEIFKTIGF